MLWNLCSDISIPFYPPDNLFYHYFWFDLNFFNVWLLQDGITALHWAAENGHMDVVNTLLQSPGINVNLQATVSGILTSKYLHGILSCAIYCLM